MRTNIPAPKHNPYLKPTVLAGIAAIAAGHPSPASATGLALPPEPYLNVYIAAAEASECGIDWAILGGIAGVASNHTITAIPNRETTELTKPSTIPEPASNEDPAPVLTTTSNQTSSDINSPFPDTQEIDQGAIASALTEAFPLPPTTPNIYGRVLDGEKGVHLITDTDQGQLDQETVWDRAVGPFQFIPSTWATYGTDANNDEFANPQDLEDAAASAANLLCTVKVDTDPGAAVTACYGTDLNNNRVFQHASELRAYWQSLQPPPPPTDVSGQIRAVGENVDVERVEGITVATRIAEQTRNMIRAAAIDGVTLTGWGWRSHERQIELRAAHCADVWLTPSSQCSPPTATPGNSRHEVGEAIDFFTGEPRRTLGASDPAFIWLTAHASEYGFYNLPSETWHWSTTGH